MLRWVDVVLRGRAVAFVALLALSALVFVAAPDRRASAPGPVVGLFDAPSLTTTTHHEQTERARVPRRTDAHALRRSKTADPSRWSRSADGSSDAFAASAGAAGPSPWTWACAPRRALAADRRGDDVRARSMVRLN